MDNLTTDILINEVKQGCEQCESDEMAASFNALLLAAKVVIEQASMFAPCTGASTDCDTILKQINDAKL